MTAEQKFELAFKCLVVNEGRYSNLPGDRGKRTWYGVSEKHHPVFFARMDAAKTDAERLDIARACYCVLYWQPMQCNSFSLLVAFRLFDSAVVAGAGAATRCLQQAANVGKAGLLVDGKFGPKTLAAARLLDAGYPRNLVGWMTYYLGAYFMGLEARKPGVYTEFLWGWGRRLEEPSELHRLVQ